MSEARGNPSCELPRRLTPQERSALEGCVEAVQGAGQTRWVAWGVSVDVTDPLSCYSEAGQADRFLWSETDADRFTMAFGVLDEVESAGPNRFRDVRAWSRHLREHIDWLTEGRETTAATLFGGFGFEPTSRGAAEWKSFPAARFVLPEIIVEGAAEAHRAVLFARVEIGSTAESVEVDLRERAERLLAWLGSGETEAVEERQEPGGEAGGGGPWPTGPEYRVQSDRSHETFRDQVRQALAAIREGSLAKLVLARSLTVDHDGRLDVPAFLGRLRSLYPTCTLFAMGRGADTFLAATPEVLIRVSGRRVETAALAGSAPRGRQPAEDRALAEQLMASEKEQAEHRHVVSSLRAGLEPACESLEIPDSPVLRALFGIQHLETPIRGVLMRPDDPDAESAEANDVLGLVSRLHPTPAVGGFPEALACEWLRQSEGLDRGWYASPVGWLDLEGGGNFRVALRSALIRNDLGPEGTSGASRALLFAGAGIVSGSDPEQELVETRIKLRALLAPLTEI